jgi:hypothetical protein
MILGDKPLISEVVLSQGGPAQRSHAAKRGGGPASAMRQAGVGLRRRHDTCAGEAGDGRRDAAARTGDRGGARGGSRVGPRLLCRAAAVLF